MTVTRSRSIDLVSVIGSAGGIRAMTGILSQLPADFPAPILYLQHLSPLHDGMLPSVLRAHTMLDVRWARRGDTPVPGVVHVCPPGNTFFIQSDGTIDLAPLASLTNARRPADLFLMSVASAHPKRAVSVILSGVGTDGSDGVRAMHASHGSVIVQDHGSASVWGMPQAALETGCTDLVLTISQIAPLLVSLVRDGYPLAAMQASGALGYGGAMAPKQDVALRHLLKTALRMQGTDLGNIQLVDPLTGDLVIAAQCGFGIDFLTHFRTVTPDEGSACARAFRDRATVFIEDVHAEPAFAPHRDIARAAGFCSVQSTPLISRAGSLLGVLSTHYRAPHRLPRTTIRNLRQLARCYVDIFESGHLDRPAAIEPFRPTPWV